MSLATLDLILSPEWSDRYYSFNAKWDKDEQMGSMRNGCGDEFYVWFSKKGCFIKGFDHESEMSSWSTNDQKPWPGMYSGIPSELATALCEPAFSIDSVSFCFWRLFEDTRWRRGDFKLPGSDDPDGSENLLEILNRNPTTYQDFAQEYYEECISLSSVTAIYSHEPITEEILKCLNPEIKLSDIQEELAEIGYPEIQV